MFQELMHAIGDEFSGLVFHAEIEIEPSQGANGGGAPAALAYSGGTLEAQPSALEQVAAGAAAGGVASAQAAGPGNGGAEVVETVVKDEHDKVGRNDPCWCGSGKKYKKGHWA